MQKIEYLRFLNKTDIDEITNKWGTPVYVYDENSLRSLAKKALAFLAPYGLTVRYAIKANPNPAILKIFEEEGILFDASSGYEAENALNAGIDHDKIMVTAQEIPKNLKQLGVEGIKFNASSLYQLEEYGKLFPNSCVGARINPGLGTGHSNKTNTAGPAASFGIWHEYVDQIIQIAKKYNLKIYRIHTHAGSGGEPDVWLKAAKLSLAQVNKLPEVTDLDLGGGFKVARMQGETEADMQKIGQVIYKEITNFYKQTGRKLHLEIEPGTFLTANAGSLISSIQDVCDTGKNGYEFLKLNTGLNDILRPSLYGAQHPMIVVNSTPKKFKQYVVVGHNCESGDLLTPEVNNPGALKPRLLQEAKIGDKLVIEGVGAYCFSMCAKGYNSFPVPLEIIKKADGSFKEISPVS